MIEAATPPDHHLSTLYRNYRSGQENWLRRRVGNSWDAADLSQDSYLREPRAYLLIVGNPAHSARSHPIRNEISSQSRLPSSLLPWLIPTS